MEAVYAADELRDTISAVNAQRKRRRFHRVVKPELTLVTSERLFYDGGCTMDG